MAIGSGPRYDPCGNEAVRARLRVDDHWNAELPAQCIGEDAADILAGAAGGKAVHDPNLSGRLPRGLRAGGTWQHRGERDAGPGGDQAATDEIREMAVLHLFHPFNL